MFTARQNYVLNHYPLYDQNESIVIWPFLGNQLASGNLGHKVNNVNVNIVIYSTKPKVDSTCKETAEKILDLDSRLTRLTIEISNL